MPDIPLILSLDQLKEIFPIQSDLIAVSYTHLS